MPFQQSLLALKITLSSHHTSSDMPGPIRHGRRELSQMETRLRPGLTSSSRFPTTRMETSIPSCAIYFCASLVDSRTTLTHRQHIISVDSQCIHGHHSLLLLTLACYVYTIHAAMSNDSIRDGSQVAGSTSRLDYEFPLFNRSMSNQTVNAIQTQDRVHQIETLARHLSQGRSLDG